VQVPKSPKGEASGVGVGVGGRRGWGPFEGPHFEVHELRVTCCGFPL
jgi:hypothetical protein